MTNKEKQKWIKEDGFYHCWFCGKCLSDREVFWVGNIKRPVCEKHKNNLNEIIEAVEEE